MSSDEQTNQPNTSKNTNTSCNPQIPMHNAGEFVATKYSGQWYIGKIKTVDIDEREYEIQFMERKKCSFQWPDHEDIIWRKEKDVICKINTPLPSGKRQRMFTVSKEDQQKIEKSFSTQ